MKRESISDSGIRRLAEDLFNNDGAKACAEAREIVKKYRCGGDARTIMLAIREAKLRMGVKPKGRQQRLEGV